MIIERIFLSKICRYLSTLTLGFLILGGIADAAHGSSKQTHHPILGEMVVLHESRPHVHALVPGKLIAIISN